MSTKHTPGPWCDDTHRHDEPHQDIRILARKYKTICTVWMDDAPVHDFNAEQEANARLIAAAPDLLSALQGLMADNSNLNLAQHLILAANARAAIAKATGEA